MWNLPSWDWSLSMNSIALALPSAWHCGEKETPQPADHNRIFSLLLLHRFHVHFLSQFMVISMFPSSMNCLHPESRSGPQSGSSRKRKLSIISFDKKFRKGGRYTLS